MKHIILLLTFLSAGILYAQPNCALSTVHCVGSGQEFATIQAAVDTMIAGDTVYVFDGHYPGARIMNGHVPGTPSAYLTIQAQSAATIIDTPATGGDGFRISAVDYVRISGFTITGMTNTGIFGTESRGLWIDHNNIQNAQYQGILLGFTPRAIVEYNTCNGTVVQHGIYVSNSDTPADNIIVRFNTLTNNTGAGLQTNGDCATKDSLGHTDGSLDGLLIEGNYTFNNSNSLSIISTASSIIRNNILVDGRDQQIKLAKEGSCTQKSDNNQIVNNTIVNYSSANAGVAGIRFVHGTNNSAWNNIIVTSGFKCVQDAAGIACGNSGEDGNYYLPAIERDYGTVSSGMFTNYATKDFTLAAGSAAIAAGVATFHTPTPVATFDSPGVDALWNLRSVAWDAGAYQRGASSAGPGTTPSAPTGVNGTATTTSVTLTWNQVTDTFGIIGYGISRDGTQIASTLTTTYVDSSVVPGTTYSYTVTALNGVPLQSAASSPFGATVYGIPGCVNLDALWHNVQTPTLTGVFTVDVDVTPLVSPDDAVFGMSFGKMGNFTDMAAQVRFGTSGTVTVRNGSAYMADATVNFVTGSAYHVAMTVDLDAQKYSVVVTPPGGSPTTVATNYSYRAGQAPTELNWFGGTDDTGFAALCSAKINGDILDTMKLIPYSTTTGTGNMYTTGTGRVVRDRLPQPNLTGDYTLLPIDNHKVFSYSGSSTITVTVPSGLGASFGTTFLNTGTGTIIFAGPVLHSAAGASRLTGQYTGASVQCGVADLCVLWGQVH